MQSKGIVVRPGLKEAWSEHAGVSGGICPGSEESAGESNSNRSAKGNRAMRRLLDQLAHAAVRKRELLPANRV